ncbi:MAG: hypothetical protein H7Z40_06105 [Phycisphaerae bacterium]|nr:hypothetical protein [Gemmatimonadaceae bacterium]
MDAFSYLAVLLSIILGLGLTQLLTATGRLIRHRDRVRFQWLPLLWAAILLLIYVQVWWSMYGLRSHSEWTFPAFCIILAQTATLYLMAAVVLPEQVEEAGIDLQAHFDRQRRWFFGFFLATIVISVAKDVMLNGQLSDHTNLAFHAVFVLGSLTGLLVRRTRYQEVLALSFAGTILWYIGVLFTRLG